jgi:hypothetical protein
VITNEHLLQAFSAAGADDGIVYMSTSITSGRRLFELSKSTGIAPEDLQSQQPCGDPYR